MNECIDLHPTHPQPRSVELIVDSLRLGAVIAYPTDSGYALGCGIGMRKPLERMRQIRQLDELHNFTLICRDLSEISKYACVDKKTYRMLKRHTPGGYTFILNATNEVPKLILAAHRKTIGIRIPDHPVALAIVEQLSEPLLSTTLILPEEPSKPLIYLEEVTEKVGTKVDIVIDGGYCGFEPTSVIDCTDTPFEVTRQGSGDTSYFADADIYADLD